MLSRFKGTVMDRVAMMKRRGPMKRIILAGGLALSTMMAGPAAALEPSDFKLLSTENLHRVCSAPQSDPLFGEARQACFGFIYGAGLFYYEAVKAGKARSVVCPGGSIDREAVRQAFVGWAGSNPERMSESPIDGLLRAAAARWPCPQ